MTKAAQLAQLVQGPAFSAQRTGAQAVTASTWTKIQFQTEEFDTANCYDNATNYRFQPTVAGYYQITATAECASATSWAYTSIYKNGFDFKRNSSGSGAGTGTSVTSLIYLNGSTDYVEVYVYLQSSINIGGGDGTFFNGALIRAA